MLSKKKKKLRNWRNPITILLDFLYTWNHRMLSFMSICVNAWIVMKRKKYLVVISSFIFTWSRFWPWWNCRSWSSLWLSITWCRLNRWWRWYNHLLLYICNIYFTALIKWATNLVTFWVMSSFFLFLWFTFDLISVYKLLT